MSEANRGAIEAFVNSVEDEGIRADASELLALMRDVTGEDPRLWGLDTIGFGRYHYRYESGQEGDFFTIGFSPRKDRLTLYVMSGLRGFDDILERLGRHRTGKSTVHLRRLADANRDALIELIEACVSHLEEVERRMGAIPRMSDIPPRRA